MSYSRSVIVIFIVLAKTKIYKIPLMGLSGSGIKLVYSIYTCVFFWLSFVSVTLFYTLYKIII